MWNIVSVLCGISGMDGRDNVVNYDFKGWSEDSVEVCRISDVSVGSVLWQVGSLVWSLESVM